MVRFRKITTAFQWFNASCCGLWLTVTIGLQCRTIRNMRSAGIHPGACAGSIGRRKNLPQVRKDLRSMPLIDALRTVLTVGGASQPLDLQLHQALGAEANRLPQQIGVRALFDPRFGRLVQQPNPTDNSR